MSIGYYDFDGEPISLLEWAQLLEARGTDPGLVRWQIGDDDVGDVRVSTVWLGIDHRFGDDGPPLIFETVVFDGPLDGEMDRYSTEAQAREGHARMVALCRVEAAVEAR